jgi:hypothetical protein
LQLEADEERDSGPDDVDRGVPPSERETFLARALEAELEPTHQGAHEAKATAKRAVVRSYSEVLAFLPRLQR